MFRKIIHILQVNDLVPTRLALLGSEYTIIMLIIQSEKTLMTKFVESSRLQQISNHPLKSPL